MPLKRALARTMASAFDDELRVTPKSLENHRKNQEVDLLCDLFCVCEFKVVLHFVYAMDGFREG
jgi:hypothetical protein